MRLLLPCLLLALVAVAQTQVQNYQPQPAVLEVQPEEEGRKVWHTRYFRLDSDMEFRPAELARLSQVADSTAMVLKNHPLGLFAPPQGQRCRIAIFKNGEDYVKSGGVPGTAGYYFSRRAVVLLQGEYFLEGAGRGMPPHYHEDIMAHEVVHLCMHSVNRKLPQWLVEGIAEYFACAHTGGGRYTFNEIDKSVRDHLRSRLSPDDPGIPLVPVADLAKLDSHEWLDYVTALPIEERYQAYATALLMAHYHLHGGEQRQATVKAAISAAADEPRKEFPMEDPAKIQENLTRYWKAKGLTLEFPAKK